MRSHRAIRELFGANALDGLPRLLKRFGFPSMTTRRPGATLRAFPLRSSQLTLAASPIPPGGPHEGDGYEGYASPARTACMATDLFGGARHGGCCGGPLPFDCEG